MAARLVVVGPGFIAFAVEKTSEGVPAGWWCRIPDFNADEEEAAGQSNFVRRVALPRVLHGRRPCGLNTVAADKTHRGHAIIEQVSADMKSSALTHLPSGCSPPMPPAGARGDGV